MSTTHNSPAANHGDNEVPDALTLQERASTWPGVVQAQQMLARTLQEMVQQQHLVLNSLTHLEASQLAVERGRALVDALIQATRLALELEHLELEESETATRAVLTALKAETR